MVEQRDPSAGAALAAFRNAAARVPAYGQILAEHGLDGRTVQSIEDFRRLVPVLEKADTFGRFALPELCLDGQLGQLASVLTSSGHTGQFAFGLYAPDAADDETDRTDTALDEVFAVRTRSTLLINCLPMGVRVRSRWCTIAETSVRADMACAIVARLAGQFDQVLLLGETAFLKHVLELGRDLGVDWPALRVHAVVGEEPLAENARRCLEQWLGIDPARPETGLVGSSMGVAEIGLNLFFEAPPLIALRRALHADRAFREALLGADAPYAPTVFTYDPARIFVETDAQHHLLLTTLDQNRRLPLIRYATGDVARTLESPQARSLLARAMNAPPEALAEAPLLLVFGRGQFALAGATPVYPEQVKEGLYHDADLARLTTANFRLRSGPEHAVVRVQLAPGAEAGRLDAAFTEAISLYCHGPVEAVCEPYESFGSGMALDYERKFDYLGG